MPYCWNCNDVGDSLYILIPFFPVYWILSLLGKSLLARLCVLTLVMGRRQLDIEIFYVQNGQQNVSLILVNTDVFWDCENLVEFLICLTDLRHKLWCWAHYDNINKSCQMCYVFRSKLTIPASVITSTQLVPRTSIFHTL